VDGRVPDRCLILTSPNVREDALAKSLCARSPFNGAVPQL